MSYYSWEISKYAYIGLDIKWKQIWIYLEFLVLQCLWYGSKVSTQFFALNFLQMMVNSGPSTNGQVHLSKVHVPAFLSTTLVGYLLSKGTLKENIGIDLRNISELFNLLLLLLSVVQNFHFPRLFVWRSINMPESCWCIYTCHNNHLKPNYNLLSKGDAIVQKHKFGLCKS